MFKWLKKLIHLMEKQPPIVYSEFDLANPKAKTPVQLISAEPPTVEYRWLKRFANFLNACWGMVPAYPEAEVEELDPVKKKALAASYACLWSDPDTEEEAKLRINCMQRGLDVVAGSDDLTGICECLTQEFKPRWTDSNMLPGTPSREKTKEEFWQQRYASPREESSISDRAMEYMQSDRGKKVLSRIKENKAKKMSEREKVSNTVIKATQE